MGVTECDNMLMLLGVSNKMSEKVRGLLFHVFTFGSWVCFIPKKIAHAMSFLKIKKIIL